MSVRPYRDIIAERRGRSRSARLPVGGDAPITVQSMTNTLTSGRGGDHRQIRALEVAGADIVRVSCPDEDSTAALKQIVPEVTVPIVADIHFHYKRAIEAAEAGAACLRINPGNIGSRERVREVVKAAATTAAPCASASMPARWSGAAGALRRALPEAMVESALNHAASSRTRTSSSSRSPARPPTCSSPWPPTRAWPRPATIRCTSASPRPAACGPAPSSPRSAWACCSGPASATPCASRSRPIRSRRSRSASTC